MACHLGTCKSISMNSATDSTGGFGSRKSRSICSTLAWRIHQSKLLSFIHSHFSFFRQLTPNRYKFYSIYHLAGSAAPALNGLSFKFRQIRLRLTCFHSPKETSVQLNSSAGCRPALASTVSLACSANAEEAAKRLRADRAKILLFLFIGAFCKMNSLPGCVQAAPSDL